MKFTPKMIEDMCEIVQDYFQSNPFCTLKDITKVNQDNYHDYRYVLKVYMDDGSDFPVVHNGELERELVLPVGRLEFPVTCYDIRYLYTPPLLPKICPAEACIQVIMVPLNDEEEVIQRITEWRVMNKEE